MKESGDKKKKPVISVMSLLTLSTTAFLIGFGSYLLIPRGSPASYIPAHLGALGAIGLLGWIAGFIAVKKGRHFYSVFLLTCILSILSGLSVVLIAGDSVSCGGSISLATAVTNLTAIAFFKKSKLTVI